MNDAPNPAHLTLVEQLRALGKAAPDAERFTITIDGIAISVHYSSGSSESLTVSTPISIARSAAVRPATGHQYRGGGPLRPVVAARPMNIVLRREVQNDQYQKEIGVNREIQTGDPHFDARVYIDTYSKDEVVQGVLAHPDARAAVLDLLAKDCGSLTIDHHGEIQINLSGFTERSPDQERGARIATNLARLAVALPPIYASSEPAPKDPTSFPIGFGCVLGLVGTGVVPLIYFGASPGRCIVGDDEGSSLVCEAGSDCCMPAVYGALGGFAVSLPFVLLFGYWLRGRSDSSTGIFAARAVVVVLCIELGIIVSRLLF